MTVAETKSNSSISYTEKGLLLGGGGKDSVRVELNNKMKIGTVITVKLMSYGTTSRGLNLQRYTGSSLSTVKMLGWSGETTDGAVESFSYTVTADDFNNATSFVLARNNSVYIQSLTVANCGDAVAVAITPATEYSTLTSASALDFTSVDGLTAYIVKDGDASDGKITLTAVNKVPANTGLVLKATTTGSPINVPILAGEADDVTGNLMDGSATATTAITANGGYILSDGAFHPANAGTLAEGKAYLHLAVTGARILMLDFDDEVTGVNDVRSQKEDVRGAYYNLNGQRVAQPTKGLYIVNGKKMIVK